MDERVLQLRVGLVMLSALIIVGILIMLFGDGFQSTYDLVVRYDTAPGVAVGTPVRKNGIRIGRVAKVEPVDDEVIITLRINSSAKVFDNEVCKLGTASILGDAVFDIVQGDEPNSDILLTDGEQIINVFTDVSPLVAVKGIFALKDSAENTLISIRNTSASIDAAAQKFGGLADNIQQVIVTEQGNVDEFFANIKTLSAKAETAVDNFGVAMNSVNELISDDELQKSLQDTLDSLPGVFKEAEAALKEAKLTIASFRDISTAAERNLTNLEGLTKPLGDRGPQLIAILESTIRDGDRLVREITIFSQMVNQGEGTISKLINDPRLYEEILTSLRNISSLTGTLKPILRDVRTATHKISTDPRILGAKGLIDRRPSGSGPKGTLPFGSPNVD